MKNLIEFQALEAPDRLLLIQTSERSSELDREILQLAVRIRHLSEAGNHDIACTKLQKIRDLAEALIPRLEEAQDLQRQKPA